MLWAPGFKLRVVTVIAELFSSLPETPRPERSAAPSADLVGLAVGTIRWDEQDTFHQGFLPLWLLRCPLRSAFDPHREGAERRLTRFPSNQDSITSHRQLADSP